MESIIFSMSTITLFGIHKSAIAFTDCASLLFHLSRGTCFTFVKLWSIFGLALKEKRSNKSVW